MKIPSAFKAMAGVLFAFAAANPLQAQYSLTFLHNNDGESRLISYGTSATLSEYGGVHRFATMLDNTRSFYETQNHGVVSIFAGDTFLAGAQFQASLGSGAPGSRTFYDALAISRLGYDASIIGNHEFDFGPSVLAEFIGGAQTTNATQYLSANLDFSGETDLQAHVTAGRIAPSTIVEVNTAAGFKKVGIIGVTTENLPFVSSPGAVVVNPVAAAVNAQIAALQADGVDHIVLAGHLQGLSSDNSLVASLNPGIDLIIAGGGDEILQRVGADSPIAGAPASVKDTGLIPGDAPAILSGSLTGVPNDYPLTSTVNDLGGNTIPIVTTGGNYGYLGRATLNFDAGGNLIGIDNSSNPQRVASLAADPTNGVAENPTIKAESVDPVAAFVSGLSLNVLATTSVTLLQGGSGTIRSRETNLGNLVADGILSQAQALAGTFAVDSPSIALVNAGGIRASVGAGNFSQLNTFEVSPFSNFVSVVEDVKLSDLKLILENAYSIVTDSDPSAGINPTGSGGRFAHIAGMTVKYDISAQAMVLNTDGTLVTAGSRILDITVGGTPFLEGGTWLVDPITMTIDIATLDFLARGGDQYFEDYLSQAYAFTTLGVTDQNALQAYVEMIAGGDTSFDISTFKPEYTVEQSISGGRITAVPEPSTLLLGLLGTAGLLISRRRRTRLA